MNRPKLRTAQRATVQDTILGAARKSLIEKGYSSFSMRGLAAEIGCSPGTIYLYFKSKEHLLSCVVEEGFDKLLEILDQVHDTDDPIHSLKSKLRAYVDFGLEFPHHYRVAFIVRESGRAVTSEGRPHAFGLFVSNDVEWASQILWTAIHGVTSLLIVMPKFPWIDRDELIDGVIDTALDGLSRPSAKAT
jgi:AcrR family transcriptional regulator